MPPESNAAAQIQIARDQAAAAWASAHAASEAVIATGLGAVATVLAVVAAFIVQRLQAGSDRRLQREATERLTENSRVAAVWAIEFIEVLHLEMETKLQSMRPGERLETAQRLLGVLDYYLARDLPSADIVAAILSVRPLLDATAGDLDGWRRHMQAQQGMGPDEVRNRLRLRIERLKAALNEVDPSGQLLKSRRPNEQQVATEQAVAESGVYEQDVRVE